MGSSVSMIYNALLSAFSKTIKGKVCTQIEHSSSQPRSPSLQVQAQLQQAVYEFFEFECALLLRDYKPERPHTAQQPQPQ